jgi:hypothetical protein
MIMGRSLLWEASATQLGNALRACSGLKVNAQKGCTAAIAISDTKGRKTSASGHRRKQESKCETA